MCFFIVFFLMISHELKGCEPLKIKGGPSSNKTDFYKALELAAQKAAYPSENYEMELAHLKQGKKFLHDIKFEVGDKVPTKSYKDYLLSIAAIVWYLHEKALEKDQDSSASTLCFKEGRTAATFFNFLQNFIRKVKNESYQKNDFSLPGKALHEQGLVASNPFGYRRKSTHYPDDPEQYGIDMRFAADESARPILYNESTHLLFGSKFIKPEPCGLNLSYEWYSHVWNMMLSFARKVPATQKLFLLESDDNPHNRKERVPADLLNEFIQVIIQVDSPRVGDKDQEAINELYSQAKTHGIKFMYERMKEIIETQLLEPSVTQLCKKFIEELQASYDHLEVRKGRELIFSDKELFDPS